MELGSRRLVSWPAAVVVPAAGGFVGSVAVTAATALIGPAATGTHGAWAAVWSVVFYAGLALLIASWAALRGPVQAGLCRVGDLTRIVLAWSAPMVVSRPLLSRDLYAFAAQGKLMASGLNPYHATVSILGISSPYVDKVSPMWRHTPAPYGPLFVAFEGFIGRHTHSYVQAVYGLRLAGVLAIALLLVFVPQLARQHGVDPTRALWLGVVNPFVLLHVVGGGHNDGLMVALLVVALVAAGSGRDMWAVALIAVAAAIKAPAGLGVVAVMIATCWHGGTLDWRRALRQAGVATAVFLVLTDISGVGWGWLSALGTPGQVRNFLSVSTATGWTMGAVTHLAGWSHGMTASIALARFVGVAVSVALAARALHGNATRPAHALGLALLAVAVLGPVLQPWYLVWSLPLLAAAGDERLFVPSILLSFVVMPNGSTVPDIVVLLAIVSTAVVALRWRRQTRPALI